MADKASLSAAVAKAWRGHPGAVSLRMGAIICIMLATACAGSVVSDVQDPAAPPNKLLIRLPTVPIHAAQGAEFSAAAVDDHGTVISEDVDVLWEGPPCRGN